MRRQVGAWTLRWAKGPGRHSSLWAANAFAIAALPLLAFLQPACRSDPFACGTSWDSILLLPRILFIPAILIGFIMLGSARAQRKHAKVERDYFARLEAADQPEIPPGHFEATPLDQDITKRTMRGMSLGALLGAAAIVPLAFTSLALRACDAWTPSEATGLPTCRSMAQWADFAMAMEVWLIIAVALLASLVWYSRSTSITVEGLPRRRRRFLRNPLAAK